MMISNIRIFLTCLMLIIGKKSPIVHAGVERAISIMNETGHKVEIYWINPSTQEMILQSAPHIFTGASFDLNSFVGHTFQAVELPGGRSGICTEKECKTAYFTVSENQEQVYFLHKGMILVEQDTKSIARDQATNILDLCRQQALDSIAAYPDRVTHTVDSLVNCVEESITEAIEAANEEITFQASIRTKMGTFLENYTCSDEHLNTTEPLETSNWYHKGKNIKVNVMHERNHSRIHFLEKFINPDECDAMEAAAKRTLHQATVADVDGGNRLSDSRKAMQAGITVPWGRERFGNPIAVLSRRVFDYTNSVTDYGLEEFGQEDLMSIQYVGRGDDDEAPDRYTPHCDGDCTGLKHKSGTRVATMVMYCDLPEKGGATNFKNSGIYVKGKPGDAVFFSYMGDDGFMDRGFTEHSGCPVLSGQKKIVTQWMRKGVDKENKWSSFNTLGVKHSDAREQ